MNKSAWKLIPEIQLKYAQITALTFSEHNSVLSRSVVSKPANQNVNYYFNINLRNLYKKTEFVSTSWRH